MYKCIQMTYNKIEYKFAPCFCSPLTLIYKLQIITFLPNFMAWVVKPVPTAPIHLIFTKTYLVLGIILVCTAKYFMVSHSAQIF
jgi:hypothetical protein